MHASKNKTLGNLKPKLLQRNNMLRMLTKNKPTIVGEIWENLFPKISRKLSHNDRKEGNQC